jgi:hypothetical protein
MIRQARYQKRQQDTYLCATQASSCEENDLNLFTDHSFLSRLLRQDACPARTRRSRCTNTNGDASKRMDEGGYIIHPGRDSRDIPNHHRH